MKSFVPSMLPALAGGLLASAASASVVTTPNASTQTAASPELVGDVGVGLRDEVRVLVQLSAADPAPVAAAAANFGGSLDWSSNMVPGLHVVSVARDRADAALAILRALPGLRYAELAQEQHALAQTTPYGISLVDAPAFWAVSSAPRGLGAKVAVLDTGIANAHPDLPVTLATQSFIDGETVFDGNSHGTHCAGTILALDNADGVVGVAPMASLIVGKVLANSGSGDTAGIIQAIEWATGQGAKVVSMSLGGGGFEQPFQDIINSAFNAGVLVVAAAGNSSSNAAFYPAWYDHVVSVGAVDSGSALASFSNFGSNVSVVAPGVNVQSTVPAGPVTEVVWSGSPRAAAALTGSGNGEVTAQVVFCGFGGTAGDFPSSVAGKIAHIRRGGLDSNGARYSFQTKVTNALNAGAIGAVISNDNGGVFSGTINATVPIPVVAISQTDGDVLQPLTGTVVTVRNVIGAPGGGYGFKSGTSMACPHVAGVATLLFAEFASRGITPTQVRSALEQSAVDLGTPGRDDTFGYGLVDALAARTWLLNNLAPGCLADIAGGGNATLSGGGPDGTVDGNDFVAFINAFATGSAEADLAGGTSSSLPAGGPDGTVDGSDFVAFINAFAVGC